MVNMSEAKINFDFVILPLLIVAFFITVHQLKRKKTKHVKVKSQVLNDFN